LAYDNCRARPDGDGSRNGARDRILVGIIGSFLAGRVSVGVDPVRQLREPGVAERLVLAALFG